jgi:hypothetical protein
MSSAVPVRVYSRKAMRTKQVSADEPREPYELRLTDTALASHELGERGADEPDLDIESLDRALN